MTDQAPVTTPKRNTDRYFKASLGLKDAVAEDLQADYTSDIIPWLRANGNQVSFPDGLTVHIAEEFGFCYGVDKAVRMAYEARAKFPDRRIFLTYEIIHNPGVNRRMREMGIHFLTGKEKGEFSINNITAEDVVILPAFGFSIEEFRRFQEIGCILVDTTCGSVVHVWKRVEKYAKDGFTSLVHGKHYHAETIATASHATALGGHTVVVLDYEEADLVCDIIRGVRPKSDVFKLDNGLSEGFDPEIHLDKIGVANQTTMLASESLEIANRVRHALLDKFGEENIDEHFRSFDTICSATQERQDAVEALLKTKSLDLMLIVGGYNSSNTGHLCELASQSVTAFHISEPSEMISANLIRHKPWQGKETIETENWLPEGPIHIGLTAGASTPDRAIGLAIARLAELRGFDIDLIFPKEPIE